MRTDRALKRVLTERQAQIIHEELNIPHLPPQLTNLWETLNPGAPNEVQLLAGETFYISLTAASPNCREGRFIANLVACHPSDAPRKKGGWPRYYFDLARAKREIESWMHYNAQFRLLCLATCPTSSSKP